jgi:subtilisin family serine protease
MRHGDTSHTEQRSSALWGRGGRDERSSGLWGRGGRSATLLTIALACMVVPAAGLAGRDLPAVVPADLLADATASPNATFAVIVQGDKDRSGDDIADRVQNGNGKLKRAFRSVNGAAAEVTGEQLLDLARDSHVAVITRDSALRTTGYEDNEIWRDAVAARPLWDDSFAGVTPPAIAIVDSGIDATKANDFGSRIAARVNLSSLEPNAAGDPSGHGTMVAGVAAGSAAGHRGVAPNARPRRRKHRRGTHE